MLTSKPQPAIFLIVKTTISFTVASNYRFVLYKLLELKMNPLIDVGFIID